MSGIGYDGDFKEMDIRKIIFVDDITCLGNKRAHHQQEAGACGGETLYIALNPTAYSFLRQKGLPVRSTESYFTTESQKKILKRSEAAINWFRAHAPIEDIGFGTKRAYMELFIFWVRHSVHYFLWLAEIVNNAIATHKPEIVSAPLAHERHVTSLAAGAEERYLGRIVLSAARKYSIKFVDISAGTRQAKGVFMRRAFEWMYQIAKFLAKHVKFQIWQYGMCRQNAKAGNRAIYFTTRHYHMDAIADDLRRKIPAGRVCLLDGPVLSYVPIPAFAVMLLEPHLFSRILELRAGLRKFAASLASQDDMLSLEGISFAGMLAAKVRNNIVDHIVSLCIWSSKLSRCLDILRPAAFVSNGNRSDDIMITELSSARGIPTVLISHGSHIYPKNEYEMIEWGEHGRFFLRAPFSFLALQTPLAEGFLKVFPPYGAILRTGPLVWGNPVNKETAVRFFKKTFGEKYERKDVRVIIHAGTPKLSTSLRLYVYETPDEYLRALSDLAEAVNAMENTLLVIRFRPSKEISIDELRGRVPFSDKVVLNAEGAFIDLLGIADLLVSFSSTTIEEALQNRIPVLLYGGNGRYQHIQAHEIMRGIRLPPSPVYHVSNRQDLGYAIRQIFDLKITDDANAHLFEPYKYADEVRVSLADALQDYCMEKR